VRGGVQATDLQNCGRGNVAVEPSFVTWFLSRVLCLVLVVARGAGMERICASCFGTPLGSCGAIRVSTFYDQDVFYALLMKLYNIRWK
jgi:hypothetical protein